MQWSMYSVPYGTKVMMHICTPHHAAHPHQHTHTTQHICTCDLSRCICSDKSICLIDHNFLLSVKSCWREFLFFSLSVLWRCVLVPHRRSLPLWCLLTCSNATPRSTSNSLCRSTGLSNGVPILGVAWQWARQSRRALRGRRRKRAWTSGVERVTPFAGKTNSPV